MVPSIYQDFIKFKNIVKTHENSNVINLKMHRFLGAATLLPLLNYMTNNNISEYVPHRETEKCLDKVLGKKFDENTKIPFEKLPKHMSPKRIGDFSSRLKPLLKNYIDYESFDLLLYETINNIYDHSRFNNAYTMIQQYPREDTTDICIVDDGVTIPGNFENVGMEFDNDAESILSAINGMSTDKYGYKIRGFGLNTIAQISTLCFKEEMVIASRKGLCVITDNGVRLYDIGDKYVDGTYIGIRINESKIDDLSSYYSERVKFRKIGKIIYL